MSDTNQQLLIRQLMQKYPGMTAPQAQQMLDQIQKQSGGPGAFNPADATNLPGMPGPQSAAAPNPAQTFRGPPGAPQAPAAPPATAMTPPTAPLVAPPGMNPPTPDAPQVAAQISTPSGQTGAAGPSTVPSATAQAADAPQSADSPQAAASAYNIPPEARERSRFGLGDMETPLEWGSKVFREGNQGLYDPNVANSPFGAFLLSHYGTQLGANAAESLLNGQVTGDNSPTFARDMLRQQAQGGGAGANQIANLSQAAQNIARFGSGDTSGMNPDQSAALGGVANDIGAQANLLRSGLHGVGGGWGAKGIDNVLNTMYTHAQNDPAMFAPGQWAQAALAKFGIS